jgi:hypothetical protein
VLTSAFHWWWAQKYSSTLGALGNLNYAPTDCYDTFPQPNQSEDVIRAGLQLGGYRRQLMLDRGEGLTKTYNRVHDRAEMSADIVELRRLHRALDEAVALAYGWADLELDHGHQDTNLGVRFTVAPAAQTEILDRLLELNHARYAREQADAAASGRTPRRRARRSPGQLTLAGED